MEKKKEEHISLYRKYRPQTFDEVIGQDHVVSVLKKAIETGSIAHAYLFAGSRGLGKTSIARIFAKEIGTSQNDLYEIDAASNRGIDDVREIRDGVNTLPFESKYKVYIIDEVHMLTKEAFNALLKTLEEPPAHAIFILATTETDKLPDTVVSRCQVFAFKKPNANVLKDVVINTAQKEGYTVDMPSAELIALLGEGSYRDTLGVLQKVLSSAASKKLALAEVEKVTGAPKGTLVNAIVSALDEGNAAAALTSLHTASASSTDIPLFMELVLRKIRSILLLRYSPDMSRELSEEFSAEDFALLKDCAANKNSRLSSRTILEFLKAGEVARLSPIPELPFELAIMNASDTSSR